MKVNVKDKLTQIEDHWNPRVIGELNGQHVRVVKLLGGGFAFHEHDHEDEMFFVVDGKLKLEFKDREPVHLEKGEFYIVPRGVTHRPVAIKETQLMMFVTAQNVNTGNVENDFTLDTNQLERL